MMFRLLSLLLLLPLFASAQTPFVPDERAYYGLIDRGSGRCLDIASASTASGAAAVQWEFTHANSQQWRLVPIRQGSEYFRIEARHSGQCLTVDKPGENMGLVQRPFQGSEQQQWRLVPAGPAGSFQLENRSEARCAALAAADKFNGTPVVAQKNNGRASQQWHLFRLRLNVLEGPSPFGPPQPLAGGVNSPGNEVHPVLSPDGKTLYFARTKFAGNTEGNTDSGDAWLSQSPDQGKTWGAPTRLDGLNTPQNNAVEATTGTGGQLLLVRGTYERDGTFRDEGLSRVAQAAAVAPGATPKTTRPEALRIANFYSAVTGTGFFMSADGQTLLLSLERGDSEGGNDIYLSRPDGSGGYTEPKTLGPVLNSPGFDFAPWLAPDGKTLYFASYGHMGYGSADMFVSQRLDESWTKWSEPRNLGPALNGPGFNAYLSLTPDGKTAYYSSSATPNGTKDIWRTGRAVPPDSLPKPAVVAEANENSGRAFLSGRVLDARTKQPVPGALVKANLLGTSKTSPQFLATSTADNQGNYQMSLLPGRYYLSANGAGLLTMGDTLVAAGSPRRDILLLPAAVGAKVDLPSIIFTQGKATLLGSAYTELNRLAIALQAAPATEVRLEGHTDNVGPADKNQQLSEDRVAEVKRYLVGRGVAENRITTVGFGGSKPKYANDREETRRLNRRVELVIVK
ncbi:RICIN domain-containing protein [Hymenobacter negativus]|uniref:PD40 domain-containing protein n=1 Tax=Hymenobacter negativus TaxID=2795026 RepID=A0ABS0QB38_9BACT|nr:RICIN domain-containing protein [Hymenobacter negativus]MBH8559883.1 PD40 domain-containing protein [Hymenobacter negativus]